MRGVLSLYVAAPREHANAADGPCRVRVGRGPGRRPRIGRRTRLLETTTRSQAVSPPCSSNRACGFPAHGSRTGFTPGHAQATRVKTTQRTNPEVSRPLRGDRAAPAWPGCRAPQGVAGASLELLGLRQSPAPCLGETHPEPGSLPSPPVLLSGGCERYYEPLRAPALPPADRWGAGRNPAQPWVSRVALCSLSTCHAPYPGEGPRVYWSVAPAAPSGLPWLKNRSTLTTILSRLAQASRMLRPVDWPIRPRRTNVPRAPASRLPSLPPR